MGYVRCFLFFSALSTLLATERLLGFVKSDVTAKLLTNVVKLPITAKDQGLACHQGLARLVAEVALCLGCWNIDRAEFWGEQACLLFLKKKLSGSISFHVRHLFFLAFIFLMLIDVTEYLDHSQSETKNRLICL